VAGVDDGGIGEWKDFFSNSRKEKLLASSGEIPATDPIGEKDISSVELFGFRKIEAETSWAVARNVEELGVGPGGGWGGGVVDELRCGDGADFLGKAKGEHRVGLKAEEGGIGVVVDGALSPIGDIGGVPDMVPVAVSQEERVGFDFFLFQEVEKAFGGIDGKEVAIEVVDVGVGSGEAACEGEGFVHWVVD
jgi:hypothetical protein